jgi:hypothetical protein
MMKRFLYMAAVGLLLPVMVQAAPNSFPFQQGSARLSIHFGGATAFNQDYSIFGIGAGYYVADGVEAGLDLESWFGNSPHIEQVSPQMRFVLATAGPIKPYAGVFYRRTNIEGYRDLDTAGARGGAYFLAGGNAYLGAGLAGETHINCDRNVYSSCSEVFPELLLAIMF